MRHNSFSLLLAPRLHDEESRREKSLADRGMEQTERGNGEEGGWRGDEREEEAVVIYGFPRVPAKYGLFRALCPQRHVACKNSISVSVLAD